jgi:hypothetical protein
MKSTSDTGGLPDCIYQWFNGLLGRIEPVTEKEVRTMWTDDCVMITNGQVKCAGIPAFVKHFNEIRDKLRRWEVELPLAIRVAQGKNVAVYYYINIEKTDGSVGRVHIAAFFELRDGRAVTMKEIAHFEGTHLELENHS